MMSEQDEESRDSGRVSTPPDSDFRDLIESYQSVRPSEDEKAEVLRLEGEDFEQIHPLLLAMIATVAADGKVLEVEVEKVASTYARVFEAEVSESQQRWIAEKAEQVFHEGYDVYDELVRKAGQLEKEMVPIIFKACCRVAMCDGKVTDEELILLLRMTRALGMSLDDIKKHAASVVLK